MAMHVPNPVGDHFAAVRYLFPYIQLQEECIDDIDDEDDYYVGNIKNPRPYTRVVEGEHVSKVDTFTPLPYFTTLLERWYITEEDLRPIIPFSSTPLSGVSTLHDMYDYILSITGEAQQCLPFNISDATRCIDHYRDIETAYADLMLDTETFKRMISEEEACTAVEAVVPVGLCLDTTDVYETLGIDHVRETQQDLLFALMNCGEIEDFDYSSAHASAEEPCSTEDLPVSVGWLSTETTEDEASTDAASWAFEGG